VQAKLSRRTLVVVGVLLAFCATAGLVARSRAKSHHHRVVLKWNYPAVSKHVTFSVYRGTSRGGPYTKVASGIGQPTYTDSSVNSGVTYHYVVTAVDGSGRESSYSVEATATIP
jgi:fibronectin type 3 domain-containing protein